MNGKTIQQMIPTREGWELALEFMVDQEWFIGKGGKIWRVRMLETASNGSLRTATVAGDFDSLEETGMYLLFTLENEWEQKAHNQDNPPTLQEGVHYELVDIIPIRQFVNSLHPVVTKHTERESELKAAKVALGVFYDPPENPMNDPLHPATEQMIEVLESGGFVMENVEPPKQGHPIIDGMIELESEEPPNVDRVEELNEDPPEDKKLRTIRGTILEVIEVLGERHQVILPFPYDEECGERWGIWRIKSGMGVGKHEVLPVSKYGHHPSVHNLFLELVDHKDFTDYEDVGDQPFEESPETFPGIDWTPTDSEGNPFVDEDEPESGESSPEPTSPDFFVEVVDKIVETVSPERSRDLLSISSRYVAGMNARTLAGTIMDRERLELIRAWRGITFSYYVDRVLRDAGKTGIETSRVQLSGPWETEDQAIGWIARERFSTEEITMAINDLNDFMNYPEDKFFDRGEWEDEISIILALLRRILADVKERQG